MRHLITPVLSLAVALAVVGYFRGWYTVSSTPAGPQQTRLNVVVNKVKWQHDRDEFLKRATPALRELEHKLHDLTAKANQADPSAQPALNQEINDLNKQHQDLQTQVNNLSTATEDHWEANKSQLSQNLNNLQTGFMRTYGRVQSGN